MSDTARRPADPPRSRIRRRSRCDDAWPWALFGFALLALIYFVGLDEGAASLCRVTRCTSGCTTGATSSASPVTEDGVLRKPAHLRPHRRGSAAACSRPGSRASSASRRSIGRSRSRRSRPGGAAHEHDEAPVVSRADAEELRPAHRGGRLRPRARRPLRAGVRRRLRPRRTCESGAHEHPARRLRIRRRLPRAVRQVPGESAGGGRSRHDHEAHRASTSS